MRNLLRKLFRRVKSKSTPTDSAIALIGVGLFFGCITITSAANLAKGNCADPKPFTDLNHCRFRGETSGLDSI